jgi:hypothetical protein
MVLSMPDSPPPDLELHERDGCLEARYLGTYSLERYKSQMERSTRACTEQGIARLLVDITDLVGYAPTTMERHEIGTAGAALSRHLEKVAVVATIEQLGPDTFATTVARNRGLSIQAFPDRDSALRWLIGS